MSSPLDPLDPERLLDIPDPFADSAKTAAPLAPPDVAAWPSSPTRTRTWAIRGAAVVAAAACEALLVWKMGLRGGLGEGASLVGVGVVLPALAGVAVVAAVQGPVSRQGRVALAMSLALLVFVLTALLTQGAGDDSLAGMGRCIMGTSMMVVGPALLAVLAMRHAFVSGASLRTAALGVGTGLLGAAATRLYCPNDAFAHVFVSHGLPIVLAAIMAVTIGTRVTRA